MSGIDQHWPFDLGSPEKIRLGVGIGIIDKIPFLVDTVKSLIL